MSKTKARTVAAKRKRGRPAHEGARAPQERIDPPRKPKDTTVPPIIQHRARQSGVDLPRDDAGLVRASIEQMAALRAPWLGCNAGRAISGMREPSVAWEVIQRIRATYARYWHAIGAPPPYAAGMNLDLMPEEFGSDGVEVEGGWDGRSEEDRVRDATRAMMHLEGVLGRAGYGVASEVKGVVLRDEQPRSLPRLMAGLAAVARDA